MRRTSLLTAACSGMAVAGYAGVLGLVGGGIDFGPTITNRLPFDSPMLAGVALLLVVAIPMTAAGLAAWRNSPYCGNAAMAAGWLLIGWIVVEVAVIRTYSWMQPVCLAYGAVVALLAGRVRTTPARQPQPEAPRVHVGARLR